MKLLKSIIVLTGIMVLFLVGMYSGIKIQYMESLEDMQKSYSIQQTIAVVNLDIGVKYGDNQVKNYSSAIIDGLDDSYVMVSAAMAESGYSSGKYGAILTFPSNLSEAIESINSGEPYSSQVEFKVNSNLPQERYINIYAKLLKLQTQINESFNYMYMESVLEEFHDAQDYVDALLSNNDDIVESIAEVKLKDYSVLMEMAAIPKGEFDPKPLPIDGFVEHASQYSDSVSKLYLSSYAVAQKDFDGIEEEMKLRSSELNDTVEMWTEDMEKWTSETNKYTREVAEYVKLVDDFHEKLSVWADRLSAWSGQSKQYADDIEEYKDNINQWAQEVCDYGNALTEFCESSEKYYTRQLLEQNVDMWNNWKNNVNEIYLDEIHNSELYKAYGIEAMKVMEQYEDRQEGIELWEGYTKDYQKYRKQWEKSVNDYFDSITLSDEQYEQFKDTYNQYLALLDTRESLTEEKLLLLDKDIIDINNEIEFINGKISEYNESVKEISIFSGGTHNYKKLDKLEEYVLSDELKNEVIKNSNEIALTIEKLGIKEEKIKEWLDSYKTLTDSVPIFQYDRIQPEIIEKIDIREYSNAENNLEGIIMHEDIDLRVPEDINIVIRDTEMPKPEFDELPQYEGITQPNDVSEEKPELTVIPPEYHIEDGRVKSEDIRDKTLLIDRLVTSYNPEEYLNEKVTGQISGIIGQYGSYLESVNKSIESNQKVNIGLLSKNYTEYSIYLSELKTQISKAHKEEQERLTMEVDSFVNNTSAIAAESESYIENFAQKLPYTRNNSVTNRLFIETAVSSLKFNNGNVVVQQNKVTESTISARIMKILMASGVLIVILGITAISVWIVQRKGISNHNIINV